MSRGDRPFGAEDRVPLCPLLPLLPPRSYLATFLCRIEIAVSRRGDLAVPVPRWGFWVDAGRREPVTAAAAQSGQSVRRIEVAPMQDDAQPAIAAAQAGAAGRARGTRRWRWTSPRATSNRRDPRSRGHRILRQARPGDAVTGRGERTSWVVVACCWLVDPLAGTPNFAARTSAVAVTSRCGYRRTAVAASACIRSRTRRSGSTVRAPSAALVVWTSTWCLRRTAVHHSTAVSGCAGLHRGPAGRAGIGARFGAGRHHLGAGVVAAGAGRPTSTTATWPTACTSRLAWDSARPGLRRHRHRRRAVHRPAPAAAATN